MKKIVIAAVIIVISALAVLKWKSAQGGFDKFIKSNQQYERTQIQKFIYQ